MAVNYEELAPVIIENVGGAENIASVYNCASRLRFQLKDDTKANTEVLEATPSVVSVVNSNGQYQVVIGPGVEDLCAIVQKLTGVTDAAPTESGGGEGQSVFSKAVVLLSGLFQPFLGMLACAGMGTGLLSLAAAMGWLSDTSGAYQLWYSFANGFLYFLPIFLGYTAAKKFGCNEFLGMLVGVTLVYPTIVAWSDGEVLGTVFTGTALEMSYYNTFFGIPIVMPASGYTSSVLPVILAVWVASKLEKWTKSWLPAAVRVFFSPFITLVITVPLTYLVIGPVASICTSLVQLLMSALQSIPYVGAVLAAAALSGVWLVLVMFGFHWAMVPIALANLGTLGYDTVVLPAAMCPTIVATVACCAVFLRSKDQKIKEICVPGIISGTFGTIEPLMYSVMLPKMIPFITTIIGSVVAGAYVGFSGVTAYTMGTAACSPCPLSSIPRVT